MSTITASNKDLTSSLSDIFSSKPSSPSSNTYEPGSAFNSDYTNVSSDASSMTWQTWLIIILILALLGFNIFIYLAKGTVAVAEFIDKYFGPLLKLFGISVLETTKQTVNVSATGTKAGVDAIADTTTGAINIIEKGATTTGSNVKGSTVTSSNTSNTSNTQKNAMPVQQQIQEAGSMSEWRQDTLDSALNDASRYSEPQPDDSLSTVQSTGKAGWCYIGTDRNTRTCSQIGANDVCMSGDIFPSQDICMNPNLRA